MSFWLLWAVCSIRTCAVFAAQEPEPLPDARLFRTLAVIDVGQSPHQVAFSADNRTALVAVPGSGRLTLVDRERLVVEGTRAIPDKPLGIAVNRSDEVFVSRYGSNRVSRYRLRGWLSGQLTVGPSPSQIIGPIADGNYLVSVEGGNLVVVVDLENLRIVESYATGSRPFPPCSTSDGRFLFVPNYQDGTVTRIDRTRRAVEAFPVGLFPSGAVVLPGDDLLAVVLRGEDRVAVFEIETGKPVSSLAVGESPFSILAAPKSGLAFVSNSAGASLSVIELAEMRVAARVAVGDGPLILSIQPDERALWVPCSESGDVYVLEIPEAFPASEPFLEIAGPAALSHRMEREMRHRLEEEIRGFHQFLEDWLTGRVRGSDNFRRLSEVIGEDFEAVLDSGRISSRQEFLERIKQAGGRFRDHSLSIRAENVRPRRLAKGLYLVSYEHRQIIDGKQTRRLSSAVLRESPASADRLEWVQIHETDLTPEPVGPSRNEP